MEKQDRRTQYTQMVLKQSLMELMRTKPIARITIKELCENANLNRCTFYAYYRDQNELLARIEDEILDELKEKLTNYHIESEVDEQVQMLEQIFRFVADRSGFCQLLLSEQGDVEFQKRVMFIAQRRYVEEWTGRKQMDQETAEALYLFAVNGSIGVVQNWLRTGMHKSPREMAVLLQRLTNQGLSAFA